MKINHIQSRLVLLPVDDIDTDQIIPARFLKATDKTGLGKNLFADWRYREDGSLIPAFVLNQPRSQGAGILLAGNNFGCGSSREHAPWALKEYGFRAVIATSFADIFRNNALKNGLLPIVVDGKDHRRLLDHYRAAPQDDLFIDLESQTLLLPDGSQICFPIDSFSKTRLVNGVDELGYLLGLQEQISEFEARNDR